MIDWRSLRRMKFLSDRCSKTLKNTILLKTFAMFWKEVFLKPWQCFENHLHPHIVCEIRSPILEERLWASRNIHNVMKCSRNVYHSRKLTYLNSSRILRIIGGSRRPNLLQIDQKVLRFHINCQPDYFLNQTLPTWLLSTQL